MRSMRLLPVRLLLLWCMVWEGATAWITTTTTTTTTTTKSLVSHRQPPQPQRTNGVLCRAVQLGVPVTTSPRDGDEGPALLVATPPALVASTKEEEEQDPILVWDPEEEEDNTKKKKRGQGIAIVLNTNARGVTPEVVERVQRIIQEQEQQRINQQPHNSSASSTNGNGNVPVPVPARVYVTSTHEQARQAAREIVKNPPALVVPVGGDGTLTTLIQCLWDMGLTDNFPLFGYIPRGTGNALGSVVGCKPRRRKRGQVWKSIRSVLRLSKQEQRQRPLESIVTELLEIATQLEAGLDESSSSTTSIMDTIDIVDLPLLQVTTTTTTNNASSNSTTTTQSSTSKSSLCFFAGVGFDSLMLQDYQELQEYTDKNPLLENRFKSVFGYCVALVTRTLPKCIQRNEHLVNVQLSTRCPESTVWVDHRRGDVVRPVTTDNNDNNNILYQGQAGIVAAGTAPFYGGGLRLFPFARMAVNTMHLRVGRIHPLRGVVHLPSIFGGSYRDARDNEFGCLDFLGTQFTLNIMDPAGAGYPVQHSGESIGHCQQVDFEVVPTPIRFVTLLPPRLVYGDNESSDA